MKYLMILFIFCYSFSYAQNSPNYFYDFGLVADRNSDLTPAVGDFSFSVKKCGIIFSGDNN